MELKAVRGMHDHWGSELEKWKWVEGKIRHCLEAFGYQEIRTPVLENIEVFKGTVGTESEIVEKQMYQIVDRGADSGSSETLVLRPEGTAAFVRAVIEHGLHLTGGSGRYYYCLPMFRYERPQKGRLRQFHQIGAELIGSTSPESDAELIILLDQIYRTFGLKDYSIRLNTLGSSAARERFKETLIEYFRPHLGALDETTRAKFHRSPLRILDSKDAKVRELCKSAPRITEFLEQSSLAHYAAVKTALTSAGVHFVEDPTIVRGLDYYSETAFEFTSELLGAQSALGAGGRYDGLSQRFGAAPFPAIGFALGLERLLIALEEKALLPESASRPIAFLAPLGERAFNFLFPLSIDLKRTGVRVEMSYEKDKPLKWQLKHADRSGAPFAVILGENELDSGHCLLKNLSSGHQDILGLDDIEEELRRRTGQ